MPKAIQILLISFSAALAISAADPPRVNSKAAPANSVTAQSVTERVVTRVTEPPRLDRTLLTSVEKDIDTRLYRIWSDNPLSVVGLTRGVYLPGYGMVFSAEMSLVMAPGGMMSPALTEDEKTVLHKRKIDRIPQLKSSLRDILAAVATELGPLAGSDQVAIVAVLPRFVWEDPSGVPIQVTIQSTKDQLLAAKTKAALDAAVRFSELK